MAFTVKTAYSNVPGGGAGWTEATESNAIRYEFRKLMNQPCEAIVYLNDVNFASTQKYTATGNNAYFGLYSRCSITDDVIGQMFEGPIVNVEPLPSQNLVKLHCRDWLYQLATEHITYDTREDIDGSGLRESYPNRQNVAIGSAQHVYYLPGGPTSYLFDYDAGGAWGDGFDPAGGEYYYVVFSHEMAGKGTVTLPAMQAENTTGTVTGDIADTFVYDTNYYQIVSAAAGGDCQVTMNTFTNIPEAKITRVDLETVYSCSSTGTAGIVEIELYDFNAAGWYALNLLMRDHQYHVSTNSYWQKDTFTDVTSLVNGSIANMIGPAAEFQTHELRIRFTDNVNAGDSDTFRIYLIKWTLHYDGISGDNTAYPIDDCQNDYLEVSEDLITAGIDAHSPYSITQSLYKYVQDLVNTYDTIQAIDYTSDVTASTDVCARHFHQMTPLEILQDLAAVDGTPFWLDDDLDLHWNDAFGVGGAPTISDTDVLRWVNPAMGDRGLVNKAIVEGMRYSDAQVSASSTDAASVADYGTYTAIYQNPHCYSLKDAETLAASLKNLGKDPQYRIGYEINGVNNIPLGDVLNINSVKLGIANTNYVVTEILYDSHLGVTSYVLTPHQTVLHPIKSMRDLGYTISQDIKAARRYGSFDKIHTETW